MPVPILPEIVRQHAEMAAFLWTVYDRHLLHPDENPNMDEVRLGRLVVRLEAYLDGLRVAGEDGLAMARKIYVESPGQGELFVLRMLSVPAPPKIADLDLDKVRSYIAAHQSATAEDGRPGAVL